MIENPGEAGVLTSRSSGPVTLNPEVARVRDYWNKRIHDLEIAQHPVGSKAFFKELDDYRFEKLDYLPRVVDFSAYKGRRLLEVGCGVGTDLVRFANGGAIVTGVDLAEVSTKLARKNLELNGLPGEILTMDGEDLDFEDATFDVVSPGGKPRPGHPSKRSCAWSVLPPNVEPRTCTFGSRAPRPMQVAYSCRACLLANTLRCRCLPAHACEGATPGA